MPTDGNKFMATHKCLRTFLSEKFSAHMTSERLYATVCMSSESSDKKQSRAFVCECAKEKTIRIINFLHHVHVCVYYFMYLWILWWLCNVESSLKLLPHSLHSYLEWCKRKQFKLVKIIPCLTRMTIKLKNNIIMWKSTYGLASEWYKRCLWYDCWKWNIFPHPSTSHL